MPRTTKIKPPASASASASASKKPKTKRKTINETNVFFQTHIDRENESLEEQESEITRYLDATDLTPTELLFVQVYTGTYRGGGPGKGVKPWNASKAAIIAGYSENSASVIGCHMLARVKIKAAVRERLKDRLLAAKISGDKTAAHYAAIAYCEPSTFFNVNGSLKLPDQLSTEQKLAVESIEMETVFPKDDTTLPYQVVKKYKFWDKQKALAFCKALCEAAGEPLMQSPDRTVTHIHTGPNGEPINHKIDMEGLSPVAKAQLYQEMVKEEK